MTLSEHCVLSVPCCRIKMSKEWQVFQCFTRIKSPFPYATYNTPVICQWEAYDMVIVLYPSDSLGARTTTYTFSFPPCVVSKMSTQHNPSFHFQPL